MKNWKITNYYEFANPCFQFVKIPDFTEFFKFVKFALSVCDVS